MFLAIGGSTAGGMEIRVYGFDGSTLTLLNSVAHGAGVFSIKWSPDGRFLAIGGDTGTGGNHLRVYEWDGSTLALLDSEVYSTIFGLDWSPDGKYVVTGSPNGGSGQVVIWKFNSTGIIKMLTLETGAVIADAPFAVSWSPNSCLIAAMLTNASPHNNILGFSPTTSTLTLLATAPFAGSVGRAIDYHPSAKFIASGGSAGAVNTEVYSAIQTAFCIVKDNFASGTGGGAGGAGFKADPTTNVVVSNFSCCNNTNYDIGAKYPISPATGFGVGETENVDCDLMGPSFIESKLCAIEDAIMLLPQA